MERDCRGGLGLDEKMIDAGLGEVGEIALRLDNHQVHIERLLRALRAALDAFTETFLNLLFGMLLLRELRRPMWPEGETPCLIFGHHAFERGLPGALLDE